MNTSPNQKDDRCIYLDAHTLSGDDIDTSLIKVTKVLDRERTALHASLDKAINTLQQNIALDPKSDYVLKMILEIRKEDL